MLANPTGEPTNVMRFLKNLVIILFVLVLSLLVGFMYARVGEKPETDAAKVFMDTFVKSGATSALNNLDKRADCLKETFLTLMTDLPIKNYSRIEQGADSMHTFRKTGEQVECCDYNVTCVGSSSKIKNSSYMPFLIVISVAKDTGKVLMIDYNH